MNSFQHFRMAERYAEEGASPFAWTFSTMLGSLAHATMARLAWQVETASHLPDTPRRGRGANTSGLTMLREGTANRQALHPAGLCSRSTP